MKREISSALKRNTHHSVTRLKSAVQFKFNEQGRNSIVPNTRIQTGTTMHTQYKQTLSTKEDEIMKTQPSETMHSQLKLKIDTIDNGYFYNSQPTKPQTSKSNQRFTVTADNFQTIEVKKRMKFDPSVRQQVSLIKMKNIKNPALKKFIAVLISKEKQFIDFVKFKQTQQLVDTVQDFIELAIGTQNSIAFVEVLLFCAQALENSGNFDLSIHLYNQTRLLCNHSKQQYDIQKMKAFIGLANCANHFELYELSVKYLKKCLQYSWINNNLEFENLVYQKLGICYFYMGNIEKVYLTLYQASFYHERSITYDYEIEDSPLRKLSCDTLKIYLNKHFARNYAEVINNALMSKLNLQIPIDIKSCQENLMNLIDYCSSPRIHQSDTTRNSDDSICELANLKINGVRLLKDILASQEFDFQVYTPKHSFRTESKCFDYLNHKKVHPKDIYHDPKYKSNPFVIDDLGIIKSKTTSMAENMSKYKLPLPKQIEIRLQQNFELNLQQKIQVIIGSNNSKLEQKNKILVISSPNQLTHKNSENGKKNKQLDEFKKLNTVISLYQNLISKLIN